MPDQSSVFEESSQQETPASQEPVQTPQEGGKPPESSEPSQQPSASSDSVFADQLASIKNERGEPKYKDLPTALEALKHSQEYIPSLRQENETLKELNERLQRELQERQALEETIERLTTHQQQPPEAPTTEIQGLTEEQVTGLLEQRLTERERQLAEIENLKQVDSALRNKFGDKAQEVVKQKCEEYGMSPQEMETWARKNPKAVSALFEVKPNPQGSPKPNTSSVSIPPIRPNDEPTLERPEKSLLSGATTQEQMEYMRKVREATYKRLGVTE